MDRELQREQAKLRKQRQRDRERGESVTSKGVTGKSVTQYPALYPALLYALVDPIKREKLGKICQSLKNRGLQGEVRYGVHGLTMDVVGELLEIT